MIKPKTLKVEKSKKKSSKIINSTKNYQIICKIFMIKSKITKLAKVEKIPPVSPPSSQKRTSDFPDFPLKSAHLNANLLGAQIPSRLNTQERDQPLNGLEPRPPHVQRHKDARLNADPLGGQITSCSKVQGGTSECCSAQSPDYSKDHFQITSEC